MPGVGPGFHTAIAYLSIGARSRCDAMIRLLTGLGLSVRDGRSRVVVGGGLAANADPGQVQMALTALQRLGFVWRPPGQLPPVHCEPGIPSLMAYVLDHAAPTQGEALPEVR